MTRSLGTAIMIAPVVPVDSPATPGAYPGGAAGTVRGVRDASAVSLWPDRADPALLADQIRQVIATVDAGGEPTRDNP
jgi:hypothetical protein